MSLPSCSTRYALFFMESVFGAIWFGCPPLLCSWLLIDGQWHAVVKECFTSLKRLRCQLPCSAPSPRVNPLEQTPIMVMKKTDNGQPLGFAAHHQMFRVTLYSAINPPALPHDRSRQ